MTTTGDRIMISNRRSAKARTKALRHLARIYEDEYRRLYKTYREEIDQLEGPLPPKDEDTPYPHADTAPAPTNRVVLGTRRDGSPVYEGDPETKPLM
jgi:hypothetical protein